MRGRTAPACARRECANGGARRIFVCETIASSGGTRSASGCWRAPQLLPAARSARGPRRDSAEGVLWNEPEVAKEKTQGRPVIGPEEMGLRGVQAVVAGDDP